MDEYSMSHLLVRRYGGYPMAVIYQMPDFNPLCTIAPRGKVSTELGQE